ncbi:MAG: SPFH domain-containing protein [Micavibrio sp.]|nr:SPFH domain-containing protein [Micavibrio sp.]
MIETIIIGGAILIGGGTGAAWLSSMIMNVKEKQEVILESFGKYVQTVKNPGLRLKKPWPFQTVAENVSLALYEMKEDLATKTKDNIFVTVPIKMHLQVEDSKKYHYESNDPVKQVMSRVAATVKQLTSNMDFAELYQARETISDQVREKVGKEITELYGMRLIDVIVDEPHAPADLQAKYNNVKGSEMERQTMLNMAEAEKKRMILEAEGRKEAQRLDGEGIAAQRAAIFENYAAQFNNLAKSGLTEDMAHQIITLAMQNDTIRDAAAKGNVIITNANANQALSDMQALGKTLTKPVHGGHANGNDEHSAPANGMPRAPKLGG